MVDSKQLTGYPSIDKPWLKYYTKPAPVLPSADMSMYDFLRENNKENPDYIALNYYGRKITYRELFANIEKVAAALQVMGIKQGEIVTLCALNSPEFVYLLYALNKIGAISNWVGLTSPKQDLREQISKTNTRIVFTVDVAYSIIAEAAEGTSVEKIINVPIGTSMPALIRMLAKLKNTSRMSSKDNWKAFLKSTKDNAPTVNTKGEDVGMIVYTGGSTGVPKGVMLSNKNLNSYYINFNLTNSCGLSYYNQMDRYLSCVPFFLAFGVSAACHGPLSHGMELILAPDPSPETLGELILRSEPNHIIAGRVQILGFIQTVTSKKNKVSFVRSVMYGGEPANKSWKQEAMKVMKKYSSSAPVLNGYGMTESTACILIDLKDNNEGLIPLGNVSIKITKPDDPHIELGYDTEGELCLSSDTVMLGYYRDEEGTHNCIFESNGQRWLRTNDLATISTDGIIKITGRIKRIYHKLSPEKIGVRVYPVRIEETILSDNNVKACAVVGVKDEITAYRTIAYIILSDKTEDEGEAKDRLDNLCLEKLPESHIPDEYRFINDFPITRAGKVDYQELERRAAESNG